jgi:uncharacterized phage-associated protein
MVLTELLRELNLFIHRQITDRRGRMEVYEINKPYTAKAIANELLVIAQKNGEYLTPMKLQKLLYFAHSWHLAFTDKPLIDEQIEAWQWGPVVASIYHAKKNSGPNPIRNLCVDSEGNDPRVPIEDCYTHSLLAEIWKVYGLLTAIQLSNISHDKGSPWDTANNANGSQLRNWPIDNNAIKKYFRELRDQK